MILKNLSMVQPKVVQFKSKNEETIYVKRPCTLTLPFRHALQKHLQQDKEMKENIGKEISKVL